jgi:hypothetical protein
MRYEQPWHNDRIAKPSKNLNSKKMRADMISALFGLRQTARYSAVFAPNSRSSNRIAACACIPGSTCEYTRRVKAGS